MKWYLIVELAAVDEVEYLHHDESIEYEGEVSGVDVVCLPYLHVVFPIADVVHPSTADCTPYNTILIFIG